MSSDSDSSNSKSTVIESYQFKRFGSSDLLSYKKKRDYEYDYAYLNSNDYSKLSNRNTSKGKSYSHGLRLFPSVEKIRTYEVSESDWTPFSRLYEKRDRMKLVIFTPNHHKYKVTIDVFFSDSNGLGEHCDRIVICGEAEYHSQIENFDLEHRHFCGCSVIVPLFFSKDFVLPSNCDYGETKIEYNDGFMTVNIPKSNSTEKYRSKPLKVPSNIPKSIEAEVVIKKKGNSEERLYLHECQQNNDDGQLSVWTVVILTALLILVLIYWIDMISTRITIFYRNTSTWSITKYFKMCPPKPTVTPIAPTS
ncbi:hypothetical protein BB559_002746 [Furculomyces boomerangus]|uniref:SHSP domain-containing protein n=2 Tax=Harpellales TaxID=61421 RepID=A0A2T9YSW9_9FUNG|nr:hypothetical protein BB559_002746 [Furculomyces boomerangus]PVZ97328.1 hypothetical protein BB558_006693 [Smittium angustum]PVZ99176.1 hypothetical protein BB558_004814 [Smittium angustum]